MEILTHASLFTGIGGFDLAAEWAGFRNILQVENDKYCLQVLHKNFPGVKKIDDIRNVGKADVSTGITVLSGGFPCQPYSIAGQRGGKADDRYFWPEMCRVIEAGEPAWVVIENVVGITSLGIEEVLADLESAGYQVSKDGAGSYIIPVIPAAGVAAPHRRDRVWIVAYSGGQYCDRWSAASNREKLFCQAARPGQGETTADAHGENCKPQYILTKSEKPQRFSDRGVNAYWDHWPAQSPVCRRNDGLSHRLDRRRLKALGNAVVPQVAYRIMKAIFEIEMRLS